jgi:hypothetical protein
LTAFEAVAVLATETRELHFKSPAPGMRFTAGLPIRVWADIIPRDDDHPGWPQAECYWDGRMVGNRVRGNKRAYDYFPFTVPAALVTPGVHDLKLKGFGFAGAINPAERSMPVHVEPWPAGKTVVEFNADMQVADLNWTNVAVRGNGHAVSVRGKLTINSSLITGLGSMTIVDPSHADPNTVVMLPGITGTLSDVDIQDSVFEATGTLHLAIAGSGDVLIKNNEFRANNLLKFVPSGPDASPVLQISGKNAKTRRFQGNRVGAGIVRFERTSGWLIGGDTDAQSNVLIGPRCVLALANCRDMHVIGNYIHHEYRGTWSQGFNFCCDNCEGILAEHNVLRSSSWPLQSFGGEFRYNLMIDSGHNWVRVLTSGTQFHHNLLVHTSDPYGTGMNAGVWLYNNRRDVAIYNNTFDGGAPLARDFNAPAIALSTGCTLSTLRNNVFTGVAAMSRLTNNAIVARNGLEKDSEPRMAYADYNCFFNPQAPTAAPYDRDLVGKKDAGLHDLHADPKFAEGRLIPYSVNEADVWNRKYTVSRVLSLYRQRYAPAAGSPLLNAGDPADGKESYIGAIGPRGDAPNDRFGRFSTAGKKSTR